MDTPVPAGGAQPSALAGALESAIFWSLCGVLAFAPMAFGAVEPWAVFVLQSALTAVAVLLVAYVAVNPSASGALRNLALLPAALFVVLVGAQVGLNLSLYRYATYVELLKVIAYGIGFVAALVVLRSSDRLRKFTLFLGIFGFGVAVFAMLQHFTSPDKLYWFRTPSQPGHIFGPYVNRNHYAGLMEMIIPFAVLGFLVPYTRREKRTLMLFAAAIMAASLVLSLSRGGTIALLVEMLFVTGVLTYRTRNQRAAWGIGALGVALIALVAWLGSSQVMERFSSFQDWMRLAIARDSLRMFADHWLYGTGLATFPTVYPLYRSFSTDLFVNQAHNDIAQLMVETGLLGLALVVWFLVLVYRRGLARAQGWMASWKGAGALAALTGVTGMLVHSAFDFNLRIPANALFFCVLCGVAAAREREGALLIEDSPRFRRRSRGDEEEA